MEELDKLIKVITDWYSIFKTIVFVVAIILTVLRLIEFFYVSHDKYKLRDTLSMYWIAAIAIIFLKDFANIVENICAFLFK